MPTLNDQLQADLTEAMRRRDQLTLGTLRLLKAAIMNAEVAGAEAITLTDEQTLAVIRAEGKKRAEAAEIYAAAGRAESADKERAELAIIERYLPAAMDDTQLASIVDEEVAVAASAGQAGPRAMGVVVKAVKARVADGADGGRIAALVKAALAGA